VSTSDPRNLIAVGTNVTSELTPSLASSDGLIYATNAQGLNVFEIGAVVSIPVVAQAQIPNGVGVEVVAGSFNI
jgi:hypothetical protein